MTTKHDSHSRELDVLDVISLAWQALMTPTETSLRLREYHHEMEAIHATEEIMLKRLATGEIPSHLGAEELRPYFENELAVQRTLVK